MALVAAIGIAVADTVPAFDAAGMAWADAWRHPALDRAFAAVTWLGSLAVLVPLTMIVALRLVPRRGWREACFSPAALLASTALTHAVKFAIDRGRPDLYPPLIAMPPDASFPSAHAAQATAVALALLLQPGAASRDRGPIIATLIFFVAAVAMSRLYLQVHFPSDIFAGVVLAAGVVLGLRACPFSKGVFP